MITRRQQEYIEAGLFEKCIKDVANELDVSLHSVSSMRRRLRYRKPPEVSPEHIVGPSRHYHERISRDGWIEFGLFTCSVARLVELTRLSKDVIAFARSKYQDDPTFPRPEGRPNARVNTTPKSEVSRALRESKCLKEAMKRLNVSYWTFQTLIEFHELEAEAQRIHGRRNRAWRKNAQEVY